MTVGGSAKIITVDFTPATSSNKRFRVANSNRKVATVSNITETGFTITPVGVGSTTITVTTVNGGKTATVTVSVSAGA
ncbi:MAG: Ig-like domain-containing protein [Clostridia bacterium]|nr:Ig-like domain-containing protein [Clostridia bacterium]